MKKREASFQTLFSHWLKSVFLPVGNYSSGYAFELKHTRGKHRFPFAEVAEHQINALLAVNTKWLYHKISDESQSALPFDCFVLKQCPAYVVIRYPTFFVLITIEAFVKESKTSFARSLSEERAKQISSRIVDI